MQFLNGYLRKLYCLVDKISVNCTIFLSCLFYDTMREKWEVCIEGLFTFPLIPQTWNIT